MEFHIFRTVATIFFTLLLLPFESESSSANQPLGYLYVTGELPLGWQNRELPIFEWYCSLNRLCSDAFMINSSSTARQWATTEVT